jgi:hypothetical protein
VHAVWKLAVYFVICIAVTRSACYYYNANKKAEQENGGGGAHAKKVSGLNLAKLPLT